MSDILSEFEQIKARGKMIETYYQLKESMSAMFRNLADRGMPYVEARQFVNMMLGAMDTKWLNGLLYWLAEVYDMTDEYDEYEEDYLV